MTARLSSRDRVLLVAASLHSVYAENRPQNVPPYELINRIFLLLQGSAEFVFYRKDENDDRRWIYIYHTQKDILFKNEFTKDVIEKIHKEEPHKNNTKRQAIYHPKEFSLLYPKNPQPIGKTGYACILIKTTRVKEDNDRAGRIYHILPGNAEEQGLLQDLWYEFFYNTFAAEIGVMERVKKTLEQMEGLNQAKPGNTYDAASKVLTGNKLNEEYDKFCLDDDADKNFLEKQIGYVRDLMDEVYKNIYESPLLSSKCKIPPNIFFLLRYYGEPESIYRFSDSAQGGNAPYPYSLRIIIPPEQREHLKETLKAMSTAKISSDRKHFTYRPAFIPPFSGGYETNSNFPNEEFADSFWTLLKQRGKNKTKAIDEILSTMEETFGPNSRSLADSALYSGFIYFKEEIFSRSGVERSNINEINKSFNDSIDNRRRVFFHYLLSATAPDISVEDMGAFLVPLRVAGNPYVALAHTITMPEHRAESRYWLRNYHFFNEISRYCERKLQYLSREKYKEQIREVVYNGLEEPINMALKNKIVGISLIDAENAINTRLKILCRIWPFPRVKIFIYENRHGESVFHDNELLTFRGNARLRFEINKNPYFYDGIIGSFKDSDNRESIITKKETREDIRRAIDRIDRLILFRLRMSEGVSE